MGAASTPAPAGGAASRFEGCGSVTAKSCARRRVPERTCRGGRRLETRVARAGNGAQLRISAERPRAGGVGEVREPGGACWGRGAGGEVVRLQRTWPRGTDISSGPWAGATLGVVGVRDRSTLGVSAGGGGRWRWRRRRRSITECGSRRSHMLRTRGLHRGGWPEETRLWSYPSASSGSTERMSVRNAPVGRAGLSGR